MTIETPDRKLQTTPEVGGMGHSVKRKEDPRFIRGKGEYIDDLVLPGMLWLDIVRSPYAHATINGIMIRRPTASTPARRSRCLACSRW
jgi:carbon-monoxide dehydrogenase large subunit